MSKQTWAAIVKKPQVQGQGQGQTQLPAVDVQALEEVKITDYPDLLPTEVQVPEPPPPKNSEYVQAILPTSNVNMYDLEMRQINRRKEALEKDIQQKLEKFNTSYAYTRFNQDMETLNQQKKALEEKEAEIKRAMILSTGIYSKRVLEVIGRIKRYLGSEAEYTSRYISRGGTVPMYCNIRYCDLKSLRGCLPEDLDDDMAALRWEIKEEISKPGLSHIHIDFTVYSQDMISILEAAIKSEIKGCIVYKN